MPDRAKHHHHEEWNSDAVIIDVDDWEASFSDLDASVLPGDARRSRLEMILAHPIELFR